MKFLKVMINANLRYVDASMSIGLFTIGIVFVFYYFL